MTKKTIINILIITLIIFIVIKGFFRFNIENHNSQSDFYRDTSHLIFTKHVKCRMDCRKINIEEIKEILEKGKINYAKSRSGAKGDRTFALEGYSHEHQHLRVVVAPENDGLVLITCIDLNKEWPCNCN